MLNEGNIEKLSSHNPSALKTGEKQAKRHATAIPAGGFDDGRILQLVLSVLTASLAPPHMS